MVGKEKPISIFTLPGFKNLDGVGPVDNIA